MRKALWVIRQMIEILILVALVLLALFLLGALAHEVTDLVVSGWEWTGA